MNRKPKPIPKHKSRHQFKKATGVHKVNHVNPRTARGGIRL